MNLHTKALYNLLRLNRAKDPTLVCEEWQIEDLRASSLEEIFARLKKMGLSLDKDRFQRFADECDSPEELADLLLEDHADSKQHDRLFLLLFELWRRLLPEKQALSIFCDELDRRIFLYDADELESDEPIQDSLAMLLDILNENVDAGAEKSEILAVIDEYSAYDITGFLIDYISELLDCDNQLYAAELIDHFAPFVQETAWFDFLKARSAAFSDPVEANRLAMEILSKDDSLTIDLLLEMLRFQAIYGELPLFLALMKKALPLLQTEEELQELLEYAADYFRRRDRDDLEAAVQKLISRRSKHLETDVKALALLIGKLPQSTNIG